MACVISSYWQHIECNKSFVNGTKGTVFWSCEVDKNMVNKWKEAYAIGQDPLIRGKTPSGLALPRRNPYVAKNFDLHSFPADNALHPLVGTFVEVYDIPIELSTLWVAYGCKLVGI